jgi:hypothetical protein
MEKVSNYAYFVKKFLLFLIAIIYSGSYKLFRNSKNIQDVDRNIGRSAFKYNFEEFEGII